MLIIWQEWDLLLWTEPGWIQTRAGAWDWQICRDWDLASGEAIVRRVIINVGVGLIAQLGLPVVWLWLNCLDIVVILLFQRWKWEVLFSSRIYNSKDGQVLGMAKIVGKCICKYSDIGLPTGSEFWLKLCWLRLSRWRRHYIVQKIKGFYCRQTLNKSTIFSYQWKMQSHLHFLDIYQHSIVWAWILQMIILWAQLNCDLRLSWWGKPLTFYTSSRQKFYTCIKCERFPSKYYHVSGPVYCFVLGKVL